MYQKNIQFSMRCNLFTDINMGEVQLIQDSLAQRDFIIEDLNNTLKLRNEELTRLSLEVWVLETGKKAMMEKIESLKKKSREEKL